MKQLDGVCGHASRIRSASYDLVWKRYMCGIVNTQQMRFLGRFRRTLRLWDKRI